MRPVVFCTAALLVAVPCVPAQALSNESAGTAVAIALPLLAGGYSIYKGDKTGFAQLTVDTLLTVGTTYALKQFVREKRPDGSDYKSFPSGTSSLAYAPAVFMWDRYGWQYGVPMVAAATYVGWSRVDAKQHHWYDVAASAGLAIISSQIFTTPYRPRGLNYDATIQPDGGMVHLSYNF
ncbi:MAG: phosphatase PAP2 family protein [Alphaproteobacteria bacterium]|nr:phosphatase PAP2 family protein [Alphaproteobacteria bacterium]